MLGCGPNTTPSLNESSLLDARHDSGRWLMQVCLVEGWDGIGWVSNLVCGVNHVFLRLLVIAVLLHHLVHSQIKLISCPTICIVIL